eukprot:1145486-Pelagomonas_calceolata.AAC.7
MAKQLHGDLSYFPNALLTIGTRTALQTQWVVQQCMLQCKALICSKGQSFLHYWHETLCFALYHIAMIAASRHHDEASIDWPKP